MRGNKLNKNITKSDIFKSNIYFSNRKANGVTEPLKCFDTPSTCEILRLACNDELVKKATVLPKLVQLQKDSDKKEYEKLWAIRP